MSAQVTECRIVLREPGADGKREVFLVDPKTGRKSETGLRAGPSQDDVDRVVLDLKKTLERSGSRVSVKVM